MAQIALVVHRLRPEALRVAKDAVAWLTEQGHEVRLPRTDAEALDLVDLGCDPAKLAAGLDLAVSLGGDGTILRTVELVARDGVPVLGVNVGHLGYLTELEPAQLPEALERILSGSHDIEERMMLAVEVDAASGSVTAGAQLALNEASIEKAGP